MAAPRPVTVRGARRLPFRSVNTPATLARMALYWLLGQALVIVVVACALPGGSSWLTLAGFVTPHYDNNIFAIRLMRVPWTDPAVFVSLQTAVQMLAVALAGAALVTLVKTNPWEHGVLQDSTPSGRDKPSRSATSAPPAPGPAAIPTPAPAQSPMQSPAPAPAQSPMPLAPPSAPAQLPQPPQPIPAPGPGPAGT